MSNSRKLQGEIDRLLKKVEEGCQAFDQIIQKVYSSSNPNQKEKHEQDLKKEIKKLQRARDQIKTWITSNEVKQKGPLVEARKNIESKMEQFKTCERDSKTKAFSKEGLMQQDRENDQKSETRNWLMRCLKDLSNQMDQYEVEIEGIPKKKQANNPRVTELTQFREKHKYYSNQLEKVLKKYENEQLSTEEVNAIKDSIDYYIESHAEDDYFEDETVFETLGLDDTPLGELGSWESGTQKSHPEDEEIDISETGSKNSNNSGTSKTSQTSMATPIINSFLKVSTDLKKTKKETKKDDKSKEEKVEKKDEKTNDVKSKETSPFEKEEKKEEEKKKPSIANPPNYGLVAKQLAANPSQTTFTGTQKTTTTTTNQNSSVLNSSSSSLNNSGPTIQNQNLNSSAPIPQVKKDNQTVIPQRELVTSAPSLSVESPQSTSLQNSQTFILDNEEDAFNTETFGGSTSDIPTGSLQELSKVTREKLNEDAQEPIYTTSNNSNINNLTQKNQNLFNRNEKNNTNRENETINFNYLQASMNNLPDKTPTPKPKGYCPKNIIKTPSYYPQTPFSIFDNPEMFSKFDTDTLFFIFYNQQGTYQQYLAAKELKRLSWRYHKKYLTWFKRHEDPKRIYPDYETGTYVYFDYETGWCQRRKTEFTFEYRFLEDFD